MGPGKSLRSMPPQGNSVLLRPKIDILLNILVFKAWVIVML